MQVGDKVVFTLSVLFGLALVKYLSLVPLLVQLGAVLLGWLAQ